MADKEVSWHMSERIMIGVVTGVIMAALISIGNTIYLVKTLNTTPSIPDRVLKLETNVEFMRSEMAKAISGFESSLNKIDNTLKTIRYDQHVIEYEQSRRKPIVDYMEKKMNRGLK